MIHMKLQPNYGAICGRLFKLFQNMDVQQRSLVLDHFDHAISIDDLDIYTLDADKLASVPLREYDQKRCADLCFQLNQVQVAKTGHLHFTESQTQPQIPVIKTDC